MTVEQLQEDRHENDRVQAKKFHGERVNPNQDDFMNKLRTKDAGKQENAVNDYVSKFDDESAVEERRANYTHLVNNFYDLVTDFYEYGWGQSFHFCPFYKGEPFHQAIARHEHFLASALQLRPGMQVLDVGCGVGGPMREIARFSKASVVGINNNAYQVERVAMYNSKAGLSKIAKAVKGDFMSMPFEDATFDAVYAIEATVHAPTLEGVFAEIFRVLKPGGAFACYEWLVTDSYDPNDPTQKRVIYGIETGNGISKMYSIPECLNALKSVGFEIVENRDLAEFDPRFEEPWYSTLQGNMSLSGFRMSRLGRLITDKMVYGLERFGLAPKGSQRVSQLLNDAADYLVEGGERELFTPMYYYKVVKPEQARVQ